MMKKKHVIAAVMLGAIVTTTIPAYAIDIGLNGSLDTRVTTDDKKGGDTSDGRMYKGDDNKKGDDDRRPGVELSSTLKAWIMDAGTTGTVTAISSSSITIKSSSGEIYTVSTTDATVRRGKDATTSSTIVVGDMVFVLGVKNGSAIAASTIIVGKSATDIKPTADEQRRSYLGTVTAKTDTTLTIMTSANVSYTVTTTGAEMWVNKAKQTTLEKFVVGDSVIVQGTLTDSTLAAKKLVSIRLPSGMMAGKITAVSGTTLTILGVDGKTYTVATTNAAIKTKGDKTAAFSDLKVGSQVVINGDITGTSIAAKTVTQEKINGGMFHRVGNFFKSFFGKNR